MPRGAARCAGPLLEGLADGLIADEQLTPLHGSHFEFAFFQCSPDGLADLVARNLAAPLTDPFAPIQLAACDHALPQGAKLRTSQLGHAMVSQRDRFSGARRIEHGTGLVGANLVAEDPLPQVLGKLNGLRENSRFRWGRGRTHRWR